jgi:hypothetical protein
MPAETSTRPSTGSKRRARIAGIATALMCALAGGAVWCLLSLYSRSDLTTFAFVIAAAVAWTLRSHGYAGHWSGALIAACSVLLASVYAFFLQAVAGIASMLGLPMRAALRQMGPAMGLDVARANLDGWNITIVAAATIMAIWLVLRAGRE